MRYSVVILVTLAFSACTDLGVEPGIQQLVGTWQIERSDGSGQYLWRDELTINNNLTFRNRELIFDASSRQFLGYKSIREGTFELGGNVFELRTKKHAHTSEPYAPELIPAPVNVYVWQFRIVSLGSSAMILRYICQPNENCIGGVVVYTRVQ
jgi:hypothetical protein